MARGLAVFVVFVGGLRAFDGGWCRRWWETEACAGADTVNKDGTEARRADADGTNDGFIFDKFLTNHDRSRIFINFLTLHIFNGRCLGRLNCCRNSRRGRGRS